jgi:hypothetical protein
MWVIGCYNSIEFYTAKSLLKALTCSLAEGKALHSIVFFNKNEEMGTATDRLSTRIDIRDSNFAPSI